MNLRQYKKLQVKTINKVKDNDLLVVRYDMDKISIHMIYGIMKAIHNKYNNCIAIPIDMNIDKLDIKNLEFIRDKINKEIERRG